jgi:hypothetical protein
MLAYFTIEELYYHSIHNNDNLNHSKLKEKKHLVKFSLVSNIFVTKHSLVKIKIG